VAWLSPRSGDRDPRRCARPDPPTGVPDRGGATAAAPPTTSWTTSARVACRTRSGSPLPTDFEAILKKSRRLRVGASLEARGVSESRPPVRSALARLA
jgi:hypothetical protein